MKVDKGSDGYIIKVYRAVNSPDNDFELLDVTIDDKGEFTDTQNPYQPPVLPPQPNSAPILSDWENKGDSPSTKCQESPKCTGQCTTNAPCQANTWKCTEGREDVKNGCTKDLTINPWKTDSNCTSYCYTVPSGSATNKYQRQS
jgi:hypothetical protein